MTSETEYVTKNMTEIQNITPSNGLDNNPDSTSPWQPHTHHHPLPHNYDTPPLRFNMTSNTNSDVIGSYDDDVMPLEIRIAGGTMGTVVLALGIFGNVVVVLAVLRHPPLRRSSNLFVTSLAVCDLFHSLLVRPLYLYSYVAGDWPFGAHLCVYTLISSNLAVLESILHVTSIAFHRYVILVHPRLGRCFRRRLAVVAMLVAVYAIPLGVVVIQSSPRLKMDMTVGRDVVFNGHIMFCSFVRHSEFRLSGVVKKTSFVVAAAGFIFYCYVRIYHLVLARGRLLVTYGSLTTARLRRELTLLRTVVAVFLTFVANYLPITLIYGLDTSRTLPYVAYFVGVMLLWTSPGLNWIIYGLMNAQYSKAYRRLFCGDPGAAPATPTPDVGSINSKSNSLHLPAPANGSRRVVGVSGNWTRSTQNGSKPTRFDHRFEVDDDVTVVPLSVCPRPASPSPLFILQASQGLRETFI